MKVLVCSVPKSGTYLMANYLKEIGFENSHYHYNDEEYSDYSDADIESARKFPENYRQVSDFNNSIQLLQENQFAVGHISRYNFKFVTSDVKVIFLYRGLRECLVSFCRWIDRTGRWKNEKRNESWRNAPQNELKLKGFVETHGIAVKSLFRKTVEWIDSDDVLHINYHDLVGDNGKEDQIRSYKKINHYLNVNLGIKDLESRISNALNKNSLTKSNDMYKYEDYWSRDIEREFRKLDLHVLNKKLGLETKKGLWKHIGDVVRVNVDDVKQYDKYWKRNKINKKSWTYGINIIQNVIENYRFDSVLDAGCGSADVVRYLLQKGYTARGIELSRFVLNEHARDLYRKGIVKQGSLMDLPYKNEEFDLIFSSEVLEHIPEAQIDQVINEFHRVAKEIVFLTISLRPSSNFNKYHVTLKPRIWWEEKFSNRGFIKENLIVSKLQKKLIEADNRTVLMSGPTKSHIHEMEWFIKEAPYELNGECEPWYFIFRKT